MIGGALGASVVESRALGGGCVADVRRVELDDGRRVVAKCAAHGDEAALKIEARMLTFLSDWTSVSVPKVLASVPGLLVMEEVERDGAFDDEAQYDAASLFAALHAVRPTDVRWADGETPPDERLGDRAFGFGFDTVIGGLHQPNAWRGSWRDFFASQRLVHMACEAERAGRLSSELRLRVEQCAGKLDRWIQEPTEASLIHGDAWGGNILVTPGGGTVSALIDPALSFVDPEVELAFGTLFGTFGQAFFDQYALARPEWNSDGFIEERRDLYNLYPLLVHVRLFGGHYVGDVEMTLRKFGV